MMVCCHWWSHEVGRSFVGSGWGCESRWLCSPTRHAYRVPVQGLTKTRQGGILMQEISPLLTHLFEMPRERIDMGFILSIISVKSYHNLNVYNFYIGISSFTLFSCHVTLTHLFFI